jgi:hypothetical protein
MSRPDVLVVIGEKNFGRQDSGTATNRTRARQKRETGGVERETGLEPATFSLEGLRVYALWHLSWKAEHFVFSYRVVSTAA